MYNWKMTSIYVSCIREKPVISLNEHDLEESRNPDQDIWSEDGRMKTCGGHLQWGHMDQNRKTAVDTGKDHLQPKLQGAENVINVKLVNQ